MRPTRTVGRASLAGLVMLACAIGAPSASAGPNGKKYGHDCYKGLYASYLDPSTGTYFARQGACVDYVSNGGALETGVDLGLSWSQPSSNSWLLSSTSITSGPSADLVVHNYGLVSESVTVTVDYGASTDSLSRAFVADGADYSPSSVCTASVAASGWHGTDTCTATVDPGQSVALWGFGLGSGIDFSAQGSITTAEFPDAVSSNNSTSLTIFGNTV